MFDLTRGTYSVARNFYHFLFLIFQAGQLVPQYKFISAVRDSVLWKVVFATVNQYQRRCSLVHKKLL